MTLEKVYKEVEVFRKAWGHDIVTDVKVDGNIASYIFMNHDVTGYIQQYDLENNKERTCGINTGCFYTD